MFSNSVLYLAENWMREMVLFVLRNRKLEMLVGETLLKLHMWTKFYCQHILTYHHEQEIVQIFTHMKLTNLTLQAYIQVVLKF